MEYKAEQFEEWARTAHDPDAAEKAAGLMNDTIDADDVFDPGYNPRWGEGVLLALNEVLDGHGVEAIRVEGAWVDSYHGDVVATYVNTGDVYTTTVLLDSETGELHLTTYGDWLQAYESRKGSIGNEE